MGKFTEYKVPLKSLQKGDHEFAYHLDKTFFEKMENTEVRGANLDVMLNIEYNGDIYNLSFSVMGDVTLVCDRCLDDLEWPIEAAYDISVKYGDDYNDDSDTLLEIPFGDNDLNVAYMIYDTVMLAIPIKHVHGPGKCNRAMTTMLKKHRTHSEDDELMDDLVDEMESLGTTPPTDPRWDALKGLDLGDE